MKPKIIRCVVACHNANGSPDFFFVKVRCTEAEYEEGDHYDWAIEQAKLDGYDGPFVVFDQFDGPDWLFRRFIWKTASTITSEEG